MSFWKKIKAFFSGCSEPEKGNLEADIEVVSAGDEDDVEVEVIEMTDGQMCESAEDDDIDVEIVETGLEAEAVELSEETPAAELTRSAPDDGQSLEASEPECSAEGQSRMTDEYVQWLRKQERQNEAADRQVNG